MRMMRMALLAMAVAALVAGCGGEAEQGGGDQGQTAEGTPAVSAEGIAESAEEAAEGAKGLMSSAKGKFVFMMEENLGNIENRMVAIKQQANAKGAAAKEEYSTIKADWDQKFAKATEELAKAKASGGEAWDDLKKGVEAAMEDLKKATQDAQSRFQ